MVVKRVEPTAGELLQAMKLANTHFGYYREDRLAELAAAYCDVWNYGAKSYPLRRYQPDVHDRAISDKGRHEAIGNLDEFFTAVGQLAMRNLDRLYAEALLDDPRYGPDFPVRLVTDMGCSGAKRKHGKLVPLKSVFDPPSAKCPRVGCSCGFTFDPTGNYRGY